MVRYHYMRGLLRKINRKVGSNMLSFSFAERVQNLNPSAIREILKYSADPEVVGLSAGNPAPEAFPLEVIADISSRIFRDRPIDALQYGTTEGYGPLRERLKAYLKQKHGIGRAFDELLITSGAQQAIELVAKVLCNPGDVVLCESPSFVGALNSIKSLGARLVGVPLEEDGIDLAALEEALKTEPNVKFLYLIPNFQNPSGITTSLEKRKRVLELAQRYGFLVLEDLSLIHICELEGAVYHFHAKDTRVDPANKAKNGVLDTGHYGNVLDRSWVFRTVGYGTGAQMWKDMMSTLQCIGYKGSVSIEHEDGLMSVREGLEKAIAFLKIVMITEDPAAMWWA